MWITPTNLHLQNRNWGINVFSIKLNLICRQLNLPYLCLSQNRSNTASDYTGSLHSSLTIPQDSTLYRCDDTSNNKKLIKHNIKIGTQLGGGPPPLTTSTDSDVIDLTNIIQQSSTGSNYGEDNASPAQPRNFVMRGSLKVFEIPTQQADWRPSKILPHRNTVHPIAQLMNEHDYKNIQNHSCVSNETLLISDTTQRELFFTGKQLKDLITPGTMTNDNTMTLYLERICAIYHIKFLSTFFFTVLRRDKSWQRVARWFKSPMNTQQTKKPLITGEQAINIPIHVHGSHWVALVRREYQGRVLFLYADDLNCTKTERSIKKLLQDHADRTFFPPTAQWLHCNSITYLPHTNECGPRTLLALTIMSSAYHIHENILMPYMHPNIAQIARVWTANIILGGLQSIPDLSTSIIHAPSPPTAQSDPFDLINWNHPNPQQKGDVSGCSQTDSPTDKWIQNLDAITDNARTNYHLPLLQQQYYLDQPPLNNTPTSSTITTTMQEHIYISASPQPPPPDPPQTILDPNKHTIIPWATHTRPTIELPENPLVSSPPTIDATKTLRVITQNPQFSFQLGQHNTEIIPTIQNLENLQTSVFAVSSPNINWCNATNIALFKQPFKKAFQHLHLSHVSSDVGAQPVYKKYKNLTGGALVMSINHWATRVVVGRSDTRGHGSFTMTTYSGKGNKQLTIICAYIAVQKGTDLGETSFYGQQTLIMEQQWKAKKNTPYQHKCPRKEAIKELYSTILELKSKNHSIILALDANQTSTSCYSKGTAKHHTIEWLRLETGLDDPFIQIHGHRPTTTTIHPNRDIDYVLTWQVPIQYISLLPLNIPASSDHFGICLDIDIATLFETSYSELTQPSRRLLTSANIRARDNYINKVKQDWAANKIHERTLELYDAISENEITHKTLEQLTEIDEEITNILLSAESACTTKHRERNPWSPALVLAGKRYTYWKRKIRMSNRHTFKWYLLANFKELNIPEDIHLSTDRKTILENLGQARQSWKKIKRDSYLLRQKFLQERAEDYAGKNNIAAEKALKAIQQSEKSKLNYIQIRQILGEKREKKPLTQVTRTDSETKATEIVTNKDELENLIILRNQCHAQQALSTPFCTKDVLVDAVNHKDELNHIGKILDGTFIDTLHEDQLTSLTESEKLYLTALQQKVHQSINTEITPNDFIQFFMRKKEKTASSFSGRHMGHYKVLALLAKHGTYHIIGTLTTLINIAIKTSTPFPRWQHSSQIMLEKGKGNHLDHLRIIQLCEADLNFLLNIVWGKRMINNAQRKNLLSNSQYALPGMTCQSAVWNKVAFCDILRQSYTPGIITDYDATAAFDRVLHTITSITCQRLGMPKHATQFLYNLLHNMEFHVVTGYGPSTQSFLNNADPLRPCQGMLQGSSSAPPTYTACTDVALTIYNQQATGATIQHPVTGTKHHDASIQFVDDKTGLINNENDHTGEHVTDLFEKANLNSTLWSQLLWTSGGCLNSTKCFFYFIYPKLDYKTKTHKYHTATSHPGTISIPNHESGLSYQLPRLEPNQAKRTLGVHFAPSGSSTEQINVVLQKIQIYTGKLSNCNLTPQLHWLALKTILEPGVLYPMMATIYSNKDLNLLEKQITKLYCQAIGLNAHFPRSVLFGPCELGGLGIDNLRTILTTTRLNYFLYHTRQGTQVGKKLETSAAHLQIEIGTSKPFFQSNYDQYGHLATPTLNTCLWAETEPYGLTIRGHSEALWCPTLQGSTDLAIMELAVAIFNPDSSYKINRCRIHLQLFTVYDLYLNSGSMILSELRKGQRLRSRKPLVNWPELPKPPRSYWKVWNDFLAVVEQYITTKGFCRQTRNPHFLHTFCQCRQSGRLYDNINKVYYAPKARQISTRMSTFHNIPNPAPDHEYDGMQTVEVTFTTQSIIIISRIDPPNKNTPCRPEEPNQDYPAICGNVKLPADDGKAILQHAIQTGTPLVCASDGSVTQNNAKHGWIITTSDPTHLNDPTMRITGSGTVDGYLADISSTRAEIHGQTAIVSFLNYLSYKHNTSIPSCMSWCDNQATIKGCKNNPHQRLQQHRKPNTDLYLEYYHQASKIDITTEWVKSHQDKSLKWNTIEELAALKLTLEAKLNIMCDQLAGTDPKTDIPLPDMPVMLNERWAIYSCQPITRKIVGHLNKAIRETLNQDNMATYIEKKHGLSPARLEHIETQSLGRALRGIPIHQRSTVVKLIHRWTPTQAFLYRQRRTTSSLCPLCNAEDETHEHVTKCSNPTARDNRQLCLQKWRASCKKQETEPVLMNVLEHQLCQVLDIPPTQRPAPITVELQNALKHQNIIGWENFLNGFISTYWGKYQDNHTTASKYNPNTWRNRLILANLTLKREIWEARNKTVHGVTLKQQRQYEHEQISKEVLNLYNNPPELHPRYPAITDIPLDIRLKRNTRQLSEWVHRITHQIEMTKRFQQEQQGQLTLQEAYRRATSRQVGANRSNT